jgi:UDPglucose 6-dehydrogenase
VKIAVIGVGHVGLVSAACFARWGHEVVGLDHDTERIAGLQRGEIPFYEPGLEELVHAEADAGRLSFTPDLGEALAGTKVAFVCVGTPSLPGGGPNLAFVERVGIDVAATATADLVLVEKSTVPANTSQRLAQVIDREQRRLGTGARIHVASNPEFLREGTAVEDTLHPDRIVVGASHEDAFAALREAYATVVAQDGCPLLETDAPTAELIKHASNGFLATKISFINAVANICDRVGADVQLVARGMGLDERIGHSFLHAGLGYGGSCFPKDVDAFIHLARSVGYEFGLLEEVREINVGQRHIVLDKLINELWHLQEKTITLLGAAFKPGTDDLREAPAIHLAKMLMEQGATVRIYDPVALPRVAEQLPDVELVEDPLEACKGAHAAVVCTEWPQIVELTGEQLHDALGYPILIDGRNAFDPGEMADAGLQYHSIGRAGATSR